MAKYGIVKGQKQYIELQRRFDEMSEHVLELTDDLRRTEMEQRYLTDFLSYKKLDEEYRYFRENAVETYDDGLPFPYFTIQ